MKFDPSTATIVEQSKTTSKFDPSTAILSDEGLGDPLRALRPVLQAVPETLQGIGRGASFGLTNYPAAALMMGVRALTGAGGPDNTYAANLAEIQRQNIEMSGRAPYKIGEIAGGIVGGGALGVGRTLGSTMARGAGIGGVSAVTGETDDPSLRGALAGATLGALGGAAVTGAGKVGDAVANYVRGQYIKNQNMFINREMSKVLEKSPNIINDARQQLYANIKGSDMADSQKLIEIRKAQNLTDDEMIELIGIAKNRQVVKGIDLDQEQIDAANKAAKAVKRKQNVEKATSTNELYKLVGGNFQKQSEKQLDAAIQLAKESAPGITKGAAAGAGAAILQGTPDLIPAYASIGAGLGGAYQVRDALVGAGQQYLARGLARIPLTGERALGPVGRLTGLTETFNVPSMITAGGLTGALPVAAIPEEQRARDRLSELADEFRLRMRGNQ